LLAADARVAGQRVPPAGREHRGAAARSEAHGRRRRSRSAAAPAARSSTCTRCGSTCRSWRSSARWTSSCGRRARRVAPLLAAVAVAIKAGLARARPLPADAHGRGRPARSRS
jgi:hypothetical protein